MRWISIIILALGVSSCTALKPVVARKAPTSSVQRNSEPVFIEHISTRPMVSGPNMQASYVLNNNSSINTFTTEGYAAGIFSPIQFKYAILMDIPVETLNNLKLFSFIDDWYGAPYHFGGSSKTGIDCSAFTGYLMTSVFGIGLPRMAKDQYNVCERIQKQDLEEGDLVFFHTTRKGISHVGIYLGNNKFVHASVNNGVTISDMSDGYYARAFRAGGRVRPMATEPTASGN